MSAPRRPLLRALPGGAVVREAATIYTDAKLFEGIVAGDECIARELRELGRGELAAREARRYLREFPQGYAVVEAEELLSEHPK